MQGCILAWPVFFWAHAGESRVAGAGAPAGFMGPRPRFDSSARYRLGEEALK